MADLTNEQKLAAAASYLNSVQVLGLLNQAIGKTGSIQLITRPKPMLISGSVRIELKPDSFDLLSKRISGALVELTDTMISQANALTQELKNAGSIGVQQPASATQPANT